MGPELWLEKAEFTAKGPRLEWQDQCIGQGCPSIMSPWPSPWTPQSLICSKGNDIAFLLPQRVNVKIESVKAPSM